MTAAFRRITNGPTTLEVLAVVLLMCMAVAFAAFVLHLLSVQLNGHGKACSRLPPSTSLCEHVSRLASHCTRDARGVMLLPQGFLWAPAGDLPLRVAYARRTADVLS